MAKVQKRDNTYWEGILKRDHPVVYADYLAGRLASIADARRAAGLLKPRTPLHELRNAWKKASPTERLEFLRKEGLAYLSAPPTAAGGAVFTPDHKMTKATRDRIKEIMTKRTLSAKDLNIELGLGPFDQSVNTALQRDTRVKQSSTRASIELWLRKNVGV